MKVAILAGGQGSRLSEETTLKPKPMVEIGGKPMLWHIMSIFASQGLTEFVIALGYKGEVIKDYFLNYHYRARSFTVRLDNGQVEIHSGNSEDWVVHLIDTGIDTQTGGRVKRLAEFIGDECFMLTYGDGVSNISIPRLVEFHRAQGRLATVTAVRPSSRFGELSIQNGTVMSFREKHQIDGGWINGGFFVFEREVLDQLGGDDESLEQGLLAGLTSSGQLAVYQHHGFWQCMDTHREMVLLNEYWENNEAPWAGWR